LSKINYEAQNYHTLVVKETEGGIWTDFVTNPKYPWLLFRADVDGLPIEEKTGLLFASKNNGKMHACGHDIHSAMLLGAIRAIVSGQVVPCYNLRFVFQRAEENPITESGGLKLVNEGVLLNISRVFGLHIWATGETGVFYSRSGALLGNSDRMQITITTTGGHVAQPHNGVNALRVAQAIMNSLEGFYNRTLGPVEPATLEPTILNSGTASNVMPAAAVLWYGVRTMLESKNRDQYLDILEGQIQTIVTGFPGASVKINRILGHPALHNTAEDVEKVYTLLGSLGQKVQEHQPILGGEDFAHYLKNRPGAFFMLGANQPGCGDHHMPSFNPDEAVLWRGILFWLCLATQYKA